VRILIVLPGALGDVVRGLPLLGRLRRRHPDATIGWVVEPLSAPVLAGHPWLDRIHRFERTRGVAGYLAVAREVRAAGYDVALDLGRSAKSAVLGALSRAPRRIGFARDDAREGAWLLATERLPPQGVERSKLEQFLAFGPALDATDGDVAFGLVPDAEARRPSGRCSATRDPRSSPRAWARRARRARGGPNARRRCWTRCTRPTGRPASCSARRPTWATPTRSPVRRAARS
jgi:hypothetical protein